MTGFFGQNFGWLVRHIDTAEAFFLLGVGGVIVPVAMMLVLFWRAGFSAAGRIPALADVPASVARQGAPVRFRPTFPEERTIRGRRCSQVAQLDVEPGELPETMAAWVIRQEREGEPIDAFQLEEIEVPEPGAFEVIVRVMAAGVNFNNVWAALGKPVSVFRYHPEEDHHIGGSDASGIVWKVGEGVTRWKPGDEVVVHCNQASYEDPEVHGLDPLAAPSQTDLGLRDHAGARSPSSPRSRPSSSCPSRRTSPGRRPPPTA